jgi:hypothetical protein
MLFRQIIAIPVMNHKEHLRTMCSIIEFLDIVLNGASSYHWAFNVVCLFVCLFVFLALQPIMAVFSQPVSGLILLVLRCFLITQNEAPLSIGLLWTSVQLVVEISTWQHTTLTTDKHPCPRWNSNPQSQQASGRRPRGHRDWPWSFNRSIKQS